MKEQQQKGIHHFPGHMRKALNRLEKLIGMADVVVEVRDGRAPMSSENPLLRALGPRKPRLIVLSKTDLANEAETGKWVRNLQKDGVAVLASNLTKGKVLSAISSLTEALVQPKRRKEQKLGMKPQDIRIVVVGIPNVGKSTLINNLAGRSLVKAENRPGVTRSEQWIRLGKGLSLLDTPGILPMSYDDQEVAMKLAVLGTINDNILPVSSLVEYLFAFLKKEGASSFARYGLENAKDLNALLTEIGQKRGLLLQGGVPDLEKAKLALLHDFRAGLLGRFTLEKADDA